MLAMSLEKSLEEQSLQARWLQMPRTFVEKFADLNDIRKISSIRLIHKSENLRSSRGRRCGGCR